MAAAHEANQQACRDIVAAMERVICHALDVLALTRPAACRLLAAEADPLQRLRGGPGHSRRGPFGGLEMGAIENAPALPA
jgi:hypothetical protein